MRVSDRRRVDPRTSLELPERLAGVLIERNEFARELTGEHQPSGRDQHTRGTGYIGQWNFPFTLTGERVHGDVVANYFAGRDLRLARVHTRGTFTDHLGPLWRK